MGKSGGAVNTALPAQRSGGSRKEEEELPRMFWRSRRRMRREA
jgi:hypothetical protein